MTTTVDPAQIEINKHTPRHVHDAFADVSQLDSISGNPRSRSSSSPANTCVATATSQRGQDSQLRRLPSHIRPILGEYYGDFCSCCPIRPPSTPRTPS